MKADVFPRITKQIPFLWYSICADTQQCASPLISSVAPTDFDTAWERLVRLVKDSWTNLIADGCDIIANEWHKRLLHVRDVRSFAINRADEAYSLCVEQGLKVVIERSNECKSSWMRAFLTQPRIQTLDFLKEAFTAYCQVRPGFASNLNSLDEVEFEARFLSDLLIFQALLAALRNGVSEIFDLFIPKHVELLRACLNSVCLVWKDFGISRSQILKELKSSGHVEESISLSRFNSALDDYLLPERPIVAGLQASGKAGFSTVSLYRIIRGILFIGPVFPFGLELLKANGRVENCLSSIRPRGRPAVFPAELWAHATARQMLVFGVKRPISPATLKLHAKSASKHLNSRCR